MVGVPGPPTPDRRRPTSSVPPPRGPPPPPDPTAAGPYRPVPLAVLAAGVTLGAAVGNAFGAFYVETAVAAAVGIVVRLTIGALADRRTVRYLAVVAAMMAMGALACALLATGRAAFMFPAVLLAYASAGHGRGCSPTPSR